MRSIYNSILIVIAFFLVYFCVESPTYEQTTYFSGKVADGYLSGAKVFFACDGYDTDTNYVVTTENGTYTFEKDLIINYITSDCKLVVEATNTKLIKDNDDVTDSGIVLSLKEAGRNGFYLKTSSEFNTFISPLTTLAEITGREAIINHLNISSSQIYLDFVAQNNQELKNKAKIIMAYLELNYSNSLKGIQNSAYPILSNALINNNLNDLYLYSKDNKQNSLLNFTKDYIDNNYMFLETDGFENVFNITNYYTNYEDKSIIYNFTNTLTVNKSLEIYVSTNSFSRIFLTSEIVTSTSNYKYNSLNIKSNFYKNISNFSISNNETITSNYYNLNFNYNLTNLSIITNIYNATNDYNKYYSIHTTNILASLESTVTNSLNLNDYIISNFITNYYNQSIEVTITNYHPYIGNTPPKLIISEVSHHGNDKDIKDYGAWFFVMSWIEIYNPNSFPLNLSNYSIKGKEKYTKNFGDSVHVDKTSNRTMTFPDKEIAPYSYLLVRLGLYDYYANNDKSKVVYLNMKDDGTIYTLTLIESSLLTNSLELKNRPFGYFELIRNNQTVDYIAICSDNNSIGGNVIASPTTGNSGGCVSFTEGRGSSVSRNIILTDTDQSSDWINYSIATVGGKNDVTNATDNDNDGIPDANEQSGTTFAGMPLYDWGARSGIKDIFVHINYMSGWEDDPGLNPSLYALKKVRSAFQKHNFAIHFDVGNKYHTALGHNSDNFDLSDTSHEVDSVDFIDITGIHAYGGSSLNNNNQVKNIYGYKNRYMPVERFQIFHYMLLANNAVLADEVLERVVGMAELPGNDSIVAWGNKGFNNNNSEVQAIYAGNMIAYTIMHELGHNLNLRHGGVDHDNYKPNFLSIMNYMYDTGLPQANNDTYTNFAGRYYTFQNMYLNNNNKNFIDYPLLDQKDYLNGPYSTNYIIDYSTGSAPDINEENFDETIDFHGFGQIDWWMDGVFSNSDFFDINDSGGDLSTIKDYNDWANIYLPFAQSIQGFTDYIVGDTRPIPPKKLSPLLNDFGTWVD